VTVVCIDVEEIKTVVTVTQQLKEFAEQFINSFQIIEIRFEILTILIKLFIENIF